MPRGIERRLSVESQTLPKEAESSGVLALNDTTDLAKKTHENSCVISGATNDKCKHLASIHKFSGNIATSGLDNQKNQECSVEHANYRKHCESLENEITQLALGEKVSEKTEKPSDHVKLTLSDDEPSDNGNVASLEGGEHRIETPPESMFA